MKRQGVIIGVLLLCLVLFGGTWFLLREEPRGDQAGESASREEEDSSVLLTLREEEIRRIEITNEEDSYTVVPGESGWEIRGMEAVPLDQKALRGLLGAVQSLKSVQEVENGREHPADFGLEGTASRVVIETAEQGEITLKVGDAVPGTEKPSHYVEKDGRVCVCYDTKVGGFLKTAESYADPQITPPYEEGDSALQVESVSLGGRGFETRDAQGLSLMREDSKELAGVLLHTYRLTSPVDYPADPSVMENWLPSFFGLSAREIAAVERDGKALPEVGFSEPWAKVKLTYREPGGEEKTAAFDLTEPDAAGDAYARRWVEDPAGEPEALPVLYRVHVGDRAWISMGKEELVSRQILSPSVLTLSELTFTREGEEPVSIRLNQNPAEHATTALWEGEELEDASFRNFYYTLISQMADEVIFAENDPGSAGKEPVAEIAFSYTEDGTEGRGTDVITYYRESERMLYVEKNGGEQAFTMSAARLETVWETLGKLLAGEKVEAKY